MTLRRVVRPCRRRRGLRGARTSMTAAILARHGRCGAAIRPVAAVMRNGDRRVTMHVTHLHASAGLSLTWVARMTPVAGRRPLMTPVNAWRAAAGRSPNANVADGAEAAPAIVALERIFARERRVESPERHADRPAGTWAPDPPRRMPRSDAPNPPGRLQLVVRKSVVLVPSDPVRRRDDGVTAAAAAVTATRVEPVRAMVPQPQPLALSPADLCRLADDVVRQIDRRATAYQERMGLV